MMAKKSKGSDKDSGQSNLSISARRIIIHVGFAKAGSSSLQSALGESKKINYFGFPFRSPQLDHFLRLELCNANELTFNANALKKVCLSESMVLNEGPIVISFEDFLIDQDRLSVPFTTRMKRLSDAFESSLEIVIIFREQWSLLRSLYTDWLKAGLCLDFNDYIKTILLRGDQSVLGYLNYGRLIQLAESVSSKVHYFFLEDMGEKSRQKTLLATFDVNDVTELHTTHKTNYSGLSHVLNRNRGYPFFYGTGYDSDMYDIYRLKRMNIIGVNLGKDFVRKIQENKINHKLTSAVLSSSEVYTAKFDHDEFFRVDEDVYFYLSNTFRKWNALFFERISRNLEPLGYIL